MKEEKYLNQKRIVGLSLIIFSILGIIAFNIFKWNSTIFYLSFGWGLGMLI